MRKVCRALLILCMLAVAIVIPTTAHADIGPKPSVIINFEGLQGQNYYATLLSNVPSTGPHWALEGNDRKARYEQGDQDYDIYLKLLEYKDADGFYFLQFFQDCSETQRFSWTYFPPEKFKILLYFPTSNNFIAGDEVLERYAFDSYYTATVSNLSADSLRLGEAGITAHKSYNARNEIVSLIIRILLTIAIELGIAVIFGFRERKQFCFIAYVNVATQVALNIALNITNYASGAMAFVILYFLLEIAVFIVEGILYSWYLKGHGDASMPSWKPWTYSLVSNTVSFALGLGLAYWIPGIF